MIQVDNNNKKISHLKHENNGYNAARFSRGMPQNQQDIEKARRELEKILEKRIDKINNNQSVDTKKPSIFDKIIENRKMKKIAKQEKIRKQQELIEQRNQEKLRIKQEKQNALKKKVLQKETEKNKKQQVLMQKQNQEKLKQKEEQERIKKQREFALKQQALQKEEAKRKQIEQNKLAQEEKIRKQQELIEQRNQEKLRIKAEKENALKQQALQKEEAKRKQIEQNKLAQEEKIRKQQELIEQRNQEKLRIKAEKERIKQEKELLNKNNNIEKQRRLEEKRLKKEQQEKLRKEKLLKKYEEETRRKREKEERDIALINERREKEKKIRKEKEEAKKERKEKALLIRKAQEESKAKEKKERKTFEEKIKDWYNNLSFVKDAQNRRELQRQTLLIDFEGADAVRSEEKIMYKYVAKNKDTGKVETGMFAAFSKLDVHSFLLAEGYEVYEITPQKNISSGFKLASSKFKASELDFFLTQLSTFLRSGITLIDSVKILSKQTKKTTHKNTYKSVIYELTMGENFSEALAKQGNIFPRLLINMIKTSELTGDLPETLDDMADYYRETEKTKKQMISAITYPTVVLCFAFVILIFIMVSVIPQFVSIYANMDSGLPAITVVIIKLSDFLKSYWVYVVAGVIAFIIAFIVLFKSIKVFRSVIQSLTMNLPVFGKIIIYNEVTMFTKTFASLLNHNVYITDCMEVLSKITNNEVYKMLIFDTITNLAKGEAISNSFKNHWAFPNIAYEMILTGERTGQLGEMMDKVASYYQEQHKNAVNQIKAFIEPVMIIVLAAIVGIVLLSVILPMFDMYQNIGV